MEMDTMISYIGNLFFQLNPSLMELPPSAEEITGEDVCFWGTNGERTSSMITYCRDLPEGKRALLASWYLSPNRHVVEFVCFLVVFGGLVVVSSKNLVKREGLAKAPHVIIRGLTAFCFWANIIYKASGYNGKIWFMVMPCNICWTLCYVISFTPKLTEHTSHVLCQLLFNCIGLCIIAVLIPDTSDLTLWGEVPFFYLSHYGLLTITPYYAFTGRLSTHRNKDKNETWLNCASSWLLFCSGVTGLFYFNFVSILSIWSGQNLNYMTSPPPTPGDVLDGQNYRILSALLIFILFIVTRIIGIGLELVYRTIFPSKKLKKT